MYMCVPASGQLRTTGVPGQDNEETLVAEHAPALPHMRCLRKRIFMHAQYCLVRVAIRKWPYALNWR